MFFACFATSVITIKLSFSTKREHDNFIPLRQSPLAAELFTPFASKNEAKKFPYFFAKYSLTLSDGMISSLNV